MVVTFFSCLDEAGMLLLRWFKAEKSGGGILG